MYSKFLDRKRFAGLALLALVLSSTACTQMMRHSNTLVFGTDTNIGVKLGQDVNQIPSIEIGYGRREAAFVPLLANTASNDSGGVLTPCAPDSQNDCHFRASHDGNDKDSYSTIASFGSKVGTENSSNGQSAEVAIAQYFATGIAAQRLVLTGGANIVQAGGDTAKKASEAAAAAQAISNADQARSRAQAISQYDQGRNSAISILGSDSGAPIDSSSDAFAFLHERMGEGCSAEDISTELETADQEARTAGTLTVGRYVDVIRNEMPSCLDTFIVN